MKPEPSSFSLLESTVSKIQEGLILDLNLSYDTRYRQRFIHLLSFLQCRVRTEKASSKKFLIASLALICSIENMLRTVIHSLLCLMVSRMVLRTIPRIRLPTIAHQWYFVYQPILHTAFQIGHPKYQTVVVGLLLIFEPLTDLFPLDCTFAQHHQLQLPSVGRERSVLQKLLNQIHVGHKHAPTAIALAT